MVGELALIQVLLCVVRGESRSLNLWESAIKELSSSSIGHLINLDVLSLSGCKELTSVSCNIFGLQYLDHLNISHCRNWLHSQQSLKHLHCNRRSHLSICHHGNK